MIYMRERQNNRKRQEGREESARSYIDELKSKFAKKSNPKELEAKQENMRKENELKANPINLKPPAQKYAISKSKGNESSHSQSKFSQSIIVHDLPENANPRFSKKPTLGTVKCFDIQIVNDLSSSRYRAQAYIQILQREKELKSRQILNLKELLSSSKERDQLPYKQEIEQLKKVIADQMMSLDKYVKYFNEGKELFLSVVMELIESRNQLRQKLTEERIKIKEKSINRCIQRIERVISIYSSFIEFKLKRTPEEIITLDELWNNVKYQEKIIELMKENESNLKAKNYHHQNTLLRYQINRLSKHNEQLLKLISSNKEDLSQLDYSESYPSHPPHHPPQESIIVHDEYSDQIQEECEEDSSISEKEQTPFQKLKPEFSPTIQHPFSNLEAEGLLETNGKLEKQLSECKNRISVLQVQKEYVLDQLQQLQRSQKQLKNELKSILEENEELREEARELKVTHPLKQDNYDVAKESEKVLQQQNELLKEKLKFFFKPNGKETVTVEQLLKLLKRKELANYHQALMELISKYEQRISQLTNSYLYQRELKQHSLTYCKGLFNLVQAKSNSEQHASVEEIIEYINKYEDIMAELKENEIDVYLRKIKSFSIGIDENSVEIIKEELKDYVYQLQTRLPTLSEEYLEDGSSIADSYHTSVDKFD